MRERNQVITEFYIKNQRELHKRVASRAGGAYNAEDVVQEAFARALKYWNSFDPARQELGAWFNTILNNALKQFQRDELISGTCEEFNEQWHEGTRLHQTAAHTLAQVEWIISQKPEPLRKLLDLYFIKGYKPRELTDVLDMKNQAIRFQVMQFRSELREKFGI
jgi:RNA polymerase sigma factor (sigma-70 family)